MTAAASGKSDDANNVDKDSNSGDAVSDAEASFEELVEEFLAENTEGDLAKEASASGSGGGAGSSSSEQVLGEVVASLEEVTAQRDDYLDLVKRVQAEFENYKRRVESQRAEQTQRAAETLVVEILPVLDACEAALSHGSEDVQPVMSALMSTLERRGLTKVDELDVAFDPEVHEAVLTEPADGDDAQTISEVMRTGYRWNGRVIRPAMVKVRG